MAFFLGFGNGNSNIAAVLDDKTKRLKPRFQSGNTDRRRSHIDTTARLPEIEGHANHANLARRELRRCAVRTRGSEICKLGFGSHAESGNFVIW
jgi:hypothetical protein